MKLITLIGSPHGQKGSTARLAAEVIAGAQSVGAENETVILKGDTVKPCRGCDVCHVKGRCIQKDEFSGLLDKIYAADGLILGSPNYIFSVSAQLKAFMDRCCGPVHCQSFTGKFGVSVVTSGGGDEAPIADFMNHFMVMTGMVPVGSVWATMGLIEGDTFPESIRQAAFDLGRNLVAAWNTRAIPSDVSERLSDFHQRMKNLVMYCKEDWPYEYEYWRQHYPESL